VGKLSASLEEEINGRIVSASPEGEGVCCSTVRTEVSALRMFIGVNELGASRVVDRTDSRVLRFEDVFVRQEARCVLHKAECNPDGSPVLHGMGVASQ